MEAEFIPYEQALALKELGFDEPCFGFYNVKGVFVSDYKVTKLQIDYLKLEECCLVPLYQQVFRWFREKYKLYVNIIYDWNAEIFRVTIMKQNEDKSCKVIYLKEGDYIKEYKTLEEAELECLKKLIEIVKEK
jgi:hypothetical protein